MSNVERSVTITIQNASKTDYSTTISASSSAPLSSNPLGGVIGSFRTTTFSGSDTTKAVQGDLTVSATMPSPQAAVPMVEIYYCASSSHTNTTGTFSPKSSDWITLQQQASSQGSVLTLTDRIYATLPQAETATPVLSLTSDPMAASKAFPSVFHDFVDLLFDSSVRNGTSVAKIVSAVSKTIDDSAVIASGATPTVHYADFSGGQIANLVAMWQAYWLGTGDCPAPDAKLIDTFRNFLQRTDSPPTLWIPRIKYTAMSDPKQDYSPPVFELLGYNGADWYLPVGNGVAAKTWNPGTVQAFLTLLASGAHMVTVSASADNAGTYQENYDFYDFFKRTSQGLAHHEDQGSSHYAPSDGVNTSGSYYIEINTEATPYTVEYAKDGSKAPIGTIVAFMTGKTHQTADTTSGGYNGFMQVEGWQAHGGLGSGVEGGARHHGDYQAYGDTYWNISTYGCSPYSEKRATTVFLAPPGWTPNVTSITCMMPYVGACAESAKTPQHWVQTNLVTLPTTGVVPYKVETYPYNT